MVGKDLKSNEPKTREGSSPSSGTITGVDFSTGESKTVAIIYFHGMPVHICEKVYPIDKPYLIPKDFKFCPFCGEKIQ